MDYDGVFEYSDVVSVQLAVDSKQLVVAPNPVQNGEVSLFFAESEDENNTLKIFNSMGVLVRSAQLGYNQTTIRVDDQPSGIYLFAVEVENRRLIERVVIQ